MVGTGLQKLFSDVTSFLIAGIAIVIMGFAIRWCMALAVSWFKSWHERINKIVDKLEEKATKAEARAEAYEQKMEEMEGRLSTEKRLSNLEGRLSELSRLVGGIYPDIIGLARDDAEAAIRAVQMEARIKAQTGENKKI